MIRILNPNDYGLFAMTQVILVQPNMLNGYGLASGLTRQKEIGTDLLDAPALLYLTTAFIALPYALMPAG